MNPVLDHGFVRVVDLMGSDAAVVQAARVSYGAGTKTPSSDAALIDYLMRMWHTSPFEMCEIKLHIKLPIFIARQWIRHRTACLHKDSMIWFDDKKISIEDVFNHGPRNNIRVLNEVTNEFYLSSIADIWKSGVKPVYRVSLDNGYFLDMTMDHKCYTTSGWLTLKEICSSSNVRLAIDHTEKWKNISNIEYIGHHMTYDLSVEGQFHNFVSNGFVVHNSVSEQSARYSVMTDDYYIPTHLFTQSSSNKQCSSNQFVDDESKLLDIMKLHSDQAITSYKHLLESGVSREIARIILPLNMYTEWYWKIDVHNLLHFLRLRTAPDAQMEIREYANAILKILQDWMPLTYAAFMKYRVNSVNVSDDGICAIKKAINVDLFTGDGMNKREFNELSKHLI